MVYHTMTVTMHVLYTSVTIEHLSLMRFSRLSADNATTSHSLIVLRVLDNQNKEYIRHCDLPHCLHLSETFKLEKPHVT